MKTMHVMIIGAMTVGIVVGCSKSPTGVVTLEDMSEAEAYRQMLPKLLKVSPGQVQVNPCAGFADVIISGVTNEIDRQRMSAAMQDFNTKNPKADQVKFRVD